MSRDDQSEQENRLNIGTKDKSFIESKVWYFLDTALIISQCKGDESLHSARLLLLQ